MADTCRLALAMFAAALSLAPPGRAQPPLILPAPQLAYPGAPIPLPQLRPAPNGHAPPPVRSALATRQLVLPQPLAGSDANVPGPIEIRGALLALREAMRREVSFLLPPARRWQKDATAHAEAMLAQSGQAIEVPQLVLVVDRDPARQTLAVMLASPGSAGSPISWQLVGAAHVSTGQAGRKDYYITPVGTFAHTDAILDFRAAGTFNEHHVRGLGTAGMRVWDFGWQWALKGWHVDGAGGDIRLQMHATDPTLLERRLGHPASEGCIRVSSSMNRFLDLHGVLDADYERIAVQDVRYRALLQPARDPTPLAGRLLVVVDSRLPLDTPPTSFSRPVDWPDPNLAPEMPGAGVVDSAPHEGK